MVSQRPTAGHIDLLRGMLALVMLGVLFQAVSWLQGRYDGSDRRKSIVMVQNYHVPPQTKTITDQILIRHQGVVADQLSWSSHILSGCLGHVRVEASVPSIRQEGPVEYAFDVKLTGPSIHPTDPKTRTILQELSETQ